MQVFEFHFNPKLKPDLIFDSFCYEPENIYEKRLGSLYMVGILKNILPQNFQFLNKLSKFIKERYYRSSLVKPEKLLKETLKDTNGYLEQIAKRGDVSWLGNLSFAVLAIKNFKLNFTKIGETKIFLLRAGKIIDIDKKLKLEEIEPYPLKIFGNIVSGKLAEDDLILVLTKEIFNFFQEKNLLNEIAKLSPFTERGLKEILETKKEDLLKISGLCLAIVFTTEILGKREMISPKITREFSFKEVFAPFFGFFKEVKIRLFSFSNRIKKPKIKKPKLPTETFKLKIKSLIKNKKILLVLSLIFVLLLGFTFSQIEEKQKIKVYQNKLKGIEEKVNLAEGFLVLDDPISKAKANSLLKENWQEISPILKESQNLPKYFSNQVLSLNQEILKKLYVLNKLEEIKEPEAFFEFEPKKFIPQKFLVFGNTLYFFSPYSKNLFFLKETGENGLIEFEQKINLATRFDDQILFFVKPTQLFSLKPGENRLNQLASLEEPYPDFNFDDFSSFKENLYFFDKKAGQIIKYLYLGNFHWQKPEFWLKKSIISKSISVDGSVWVLEKDNSLSKYYAGNLTEKIEPDIFPFPKDFSKIFTSPTLPYLYILEPIQKRMIILSKTGQIIKQFQSEKFDNLLDFAISENGKTIWVLNGLKVYQIESTY